MCTVCLQVFFFPTAAERSRQVFTFVCDNCQVKDISIEGRHPKEANIPLWELISWTFPHTDLHYLCLCMCFLGNGQLIALDLVSGETEPPVVGDLHDITAEHFVRFSPCNPHSVQQKKLVIRNNV